MVDHFELNRRWVVVIIGAILITVGARYFTRQGADTRRRLTAVAEIADIDQTVLANGMIEPYGLVSVGAQASGQIKSLKVKLGDRVKTGDLIAEIDDITEKNALNNARAALDSLRALRNVQIAMLKQSRLAFRRQSEMLDEEATSHADYESAEATLATTKAQIASLNAQIIQGLTTLGTAQATLGYTKIKAPINGTVVAIMAKEGQTVNAVQTTPTIAKLAQLETVTVRAEVSEADVNRVRAGQRVYFTVLGDPRKRIYGTLRTVEPAPPSIEAESSTGAAAARSGSTGNAVYYNGLFEVPNLGGELRISMTAQVYIVLAEAKNTLTIPVAAMRERADDGSYSVAVLNADGKSFLRSIRVGINNNIVAQVLSGLSAGERVVVSE